MQDNWRSTRIGEASRPPRRPPGRASLDLNLLPDRHRRRPIRLADVAPALASLGLLVLLLPIFNRFQDANQSFQRVQAELESQQRVLEGRGPVQQRIDQMQSDLDLLESETSDLRSSYETFRIQKIAWYEPLLSITSAVPFNGKLVRVEQRGNLIHLLGESDDHQTILIYQDRLTDLPTVESVLIERIARLPVNGAEQPDSEQTTGAGQIRPLQFEILLSMRQSNEISPESADGANAQDTGGGS